MLLKSSKLNEVYVYINLKIFNTTLNNSKIKIFDLKNIHLISKYITETNEKRVCKAYKFL